MARYLSEEWFRALPAPPDAGGSTTSPGDLVLQHRVTGGPDGEVWYHVRIRENGVAVLPGRAEHPQVSFSEDYATAAAVAQGRLGVVGALMSGQIRMEGDMAALLERRDNLRLDDPLPGAVRDATTY